MDETEVKLRVEAFFSLEADTWVAADRDDWAWSSSLQNDMSEILDEMETSGITLDEQENDPDTCHILKEGKPYLVFFVADWVWDNDEVSS